jgi:hypothetical protein
MVKKHEVNGYFSVVIVQNLAKETQVLGVFQESFIYLLPKKPIFHQN